MKERCGANVEKSTGKKFLMADPRCSLEEGHAGAHSWEFILSAMNLTQVIPVSPMGRGPVTK